VDVDPMALAELAVRHGFVTPSELATALELGGGMLPPRWLEGAARLTPSQLAALEDELAHGALARTQLPGAAAFKTTAPFQGPPAPADRAPADRVGVQRTLAQYPVEGELGAGGMGQVLLVRDPALGRQVAAKVMLRRGDEVLRAKFVQEARLTGSLEHPHIVPVHELGATPDGHPYFTMKRVSGKTLGECIAQVARRQRADRGGLLELLQVFIKVCDAVGFAHSKGVIHRDLKPDNVMTGEFGEVYVMDFGLAKRLDAPADPTAVTAALAAAHSGAPGGSPMLTQEGSVLGTPSYMSPEQADGRVSEVGIRSDLYSLGAILYEILVHEPPFVGATAWDVLVRVAAGDVVPPSKRVVGREIPWELEAVVLRAMAREVDRRYASASEIKDDVLAYLAGGMVGAARYSVIQRAGKWIRRHRTAALVGAVALALTAAFVAREQWVLHHELEAELAQASADLAHHAAPVEAFVASWQARSARGEARAAQAAETLADTALRREGIERCLAAINRIDRVLARRAGDRAIELRQVAGRRLGWLALAGGDYALARWGFAGLTASGVSAEEVAGLCRTVDGLRDAEPVHRKRRLGDMLEDLHGGLARPDRPTPQTLDDYVLEAAAYRDLETVSRLAAVLAALAARATEAGDQEVVWTQRERDLAVFACRVLGRLQLAEGVEPVARWLDLVRDRFLIEEAAIALCNMGRPECYPAVLRVRNRFDVNSSTWKRITRRLFMLPAASDEVDDAMRAMVRHDRGDFAGAIEDYGRALERRPGDPDIWTNRGTASRALGRFAEALADFDRALAINPRHASALLNRAAIHVLNRDLARALVDYDRALTTGALRSVALRQRGFTYLQLGRFAEAREDLDAALRQDPADAMAYVVRCALRHRMGEREGAMRDAETAIGIDPDLADAYDIRAVIHRDAGNFRGAIEDYSRAIALSPRVVSFYVNRGIARDLALDGEGALADYAQALAIDPGCARAHSMRGMVFYHRKDLDTAMREFEAALALDERDLDGLVGRASVHDERGARGEARADLDRAVAVAPHSAVPYNNRGSLRAEEGDIEGAFADFDRALELDKSDATAYFNRGSLHARRTGNFDAALADLTQAVERRPDVVLFWVQRGEAHLAANHPGPGLADLERATRIDPSSFNAWHQLGRARVVHADKTSAIQALTRALELAPDDKKAQVRGDLATARFR